MTLEHIVQSTQLSLTHHHSVYAALLQAQVKNRDASCVPRLMKLKDRAQQLKHS
jgi:hypothetical protein